MKQLYGGIGYGYINKKVTLKVKHKGFTKGFNRVSDAINSIKNLEEGNALTGNHQQKRASTYRKSPFLYLFAESKGFEPLIPL